MKKNTHSDEHEKAVCESVANAFPSLVARLSELVRIPSVSWPAFDPDQVQRSAEKVAELARETGVFESVLISQASIPGSEERGQPAVLATRAARNDRPTVMLYAHHDVQPPGRDEEWETEPFVPTVRGERLYGRGTADDKAGIMTHIAALTALAEGGDPDLGIVLFVEGEEENGSRSFVPFLNQHKEALTADVIVVADSDNWTVDTPSLTVGLRGNVTFRLTVSTLNHASHSGFFGGAVPDAFTAVIKLLASFWDDNGSVTVKGLHKASVDVLDYSEEQLRQDAGFRDGVVPIGAGEILHRMWAQPAITVTGVDAPSVAHASNTLVPSIAVKVSVRVAPGQNAQEAFRAIEDHLRAHVPFGAHLDFDDVDLGNPFLVDTSGWAISEMKNAMRDGWGTPAVETCVGGSIPFISQLSEVFPEAQIVITGVEDPDTRAHSPNESLHLGVFKRAIFTEALFLHRLNKTTRKKT